MVDPMSISELKSYILEYLLRLQYAKKYCQGSPLVKLAIDSEAKRLDNYLCSNVITHQLVELALAIRNNDWTQVAAILHPGLSD